MTRICEKFIEELTSGNRQFSTELREHLASCPDCQQAAENLSLLKTHRKSVTGKEAASIAAVLKAVQTAEAAAAASTVTSSSATAAAPAAIAIPFKFVLLTLLAAAAAISIFINAELKKDLATMPPAQTDQQPAVSINQGNADQPGQAVSATDSEIIATETVSGYNSSGTITAGPAHQVEETTASTATEVKMFSPDEEEISP